MDAKGFSRGTRRDLRWQSLAAGTNLKGYPPVSLWLWEIPYGGLNGKLKQHCHV